MKKKQLKINEHPKIITARHKKRKQFIVDANRLQFDEYMLGQIKKNKHSIKKLKKQVVELKTEVKKLHDCRDDYLMFQKSKTQDRSSSSRSQVLISRFQRKIFLPKALQRHNYKSSSKGKSKESSFVSKSSCNSSITRRSLQKNQNLQSNISKQRLAKKIKQLKAKARIQSTQKRIIKLQVQKKINKIVKQEAQAEIKNSQHKTPPKDQIKTQENQVGYEQLLQLLKTNKSIQSNKKINFTPQSVHVTQFLSEQRDKESSCLKIYQNQKFQCEKTLHSSKVHFQPKSSNQIVHYVQQKRPKEKEERMESQTNLLQSSPKIESPHRSKKVLKLSQCVDMKIMNQNNSSEQGSGYDGLFAGNHFKSEALQLSFQGRDNSKRRLHELQFEFDQLVRQQLLSMDVREKELLNLAIRSVLNSITELKDKISREGK